ncbi:MAG: hypothetical protein GY865_05640 [candidate division Zixibacteria bacterium]|nr:hypothetical protein [candidate division Zixibacteria bacterium]
MTDDTTPTKPVNKNALWIIITILLMVGNILLLISLMSTKADLERFSEPADEISNLDIELSDCRVRLDDATAREKDKDRQITRLENKNKKLKDEVKGMSGLSSQAIRKFKNSGLNRPELEIIDDLMKHPNLIPVKSGSLDGMKFYEKKKVFILSENLVYAHFSDGTKNGTMILEYSVTSDGRISWVPIKAYEGGSF